MVDGEHFMFKCCDMSSLGKRKEKGKHMYLNETPSLLILLVKKLRVNRNIRKKCTRKKKSIHEKFILGKKLDYLQGKTAPEARFMLIWGA